MKQTTQKSKKLTLPQKLLKWSILLIPYTIFILRMILQSADAIAQGGAFKLLEKLNLNQTPKNPL